MADELLGTWVFKDVIDVEIANVGEYKQFNISFTADIFDWQDGKNVKLDNIILPHKFYDEGLNLTITAMLFNFIDNLDFPAMIYGVDTTPTPAPPYDKLFANGWHGVGENYRTITITDISSLTNRAEFTTWLKANATKQKPTPTMYKTSVWNNEGTQQYTIETSDAVRKVKLTATESQKSLLITDKNGETVLLQWTSSFAHKSFKGLALSANSATTFIDVDQEKTVTWDADTKLYEVYVDTKKRLTEVFSNDGTEPRGAMQTYATKQLVVTVSGDSKTLKLTDDTGVVDELTWTSKLPGCQFLGLSRDVNATLVRYPIDVVHDVDFQNNITLYEVWKDERKYWRQIIYKGKPVKLVNGKEVNDIYVNGVRYTKFAPKPAYDYTQEGTILKLNNAPYEQIGTEVIIK